MPQGLAPPGTGQCFGRETELELLDSLMGRARDGTGASFVLLSGPGGIGKSTLMAAARHRLQGSGAMVLEGWCSPGRPSYAPVLEVVRRALQVLGRSGDGVAESFATWRDCLAILEGESLPSGEQSDPRRTPEAARINLFDQLAQSLSMLSSTRPLAVVLHDLDLADHGTLDLVRFLGSMLTAEPSLGNESPFHGLLIATASDPAPLLCEPGWADQVRLMELELSGLNEEAVQRYLSSGTVVKTALAATGGNPRLLDAIFQTAPERLSAGPRLTGVAMVERVPGAVEVLRLLAVAGRPLGVEELGRLTQLDQPALSGAVAKLVNAGLVDKSFREGELLLSYAHSEDQSVAYQEINSGERAALHVRIADHLEAMGGDQELEACADHLLRAGVGERAVSLCLEAGQRLEIALSFSRAIELYERALPMAARRDQKVALLEKLCSLLEMTGKLDSALAHADGLAGLLPGDPHVALRIANLNLLRNDFLGAEQVLDGISLDHGSSPDSETRCIAARVLAHRAEARFFAGDTEAALDAAMEGLSLCEDSGEEALALLRITLLNTVTKLHLERGDDAGAHRCATEALALARAAGRVAEELRTLGLLGQREMNRAEYAAAEDWYQQARTLAEAVGEHRLLGVYLQHLGVLAERRRDYGEALEHYQQAVGAFKKVSHRAYLSWVATDLGKLYLDLGDIERAQTMLEMSGRLVDGEPAMAAQVNLELLRGRIAQQELRVGEARGCYERARKLASEAGQVERLARAVIALAGLELQRDDAAAALSLLNHSEVLPVSGTPKVDALALMIQAELRLGHQESAETHLAQLVELGDLLRDGEAAWQAPFLLARLRADQARPGEHLRLLRQARRLERCTREGLPPDLDKSLSDHPLRAALRRDLASIEQGSGPAGDWAEEKTKKLESQDGEGPSVDTPEGPFHLIIGEHPKLLTVLRHVERLAPTDTTVLIRGESGTGKELIASAIHERSQRADRPMVAVNCGALVESLLLSELFGHERGAFTGASQRRKGRFEVADGGTIFLDEIGDVSPRTQAALLRVLQEREVTRVGGTQPIQVDVRVICATNRDLEGMVSRGEFREDLYYRLRGVQLQLPPLRERAEDIPLLTGHFLATFSDGHPGKRSLTPGAMELLCQAKWPGNVRELKNVLRSAALLSDGDSLEPADFEDYPELVRVNSTENSQQHEPQVFGGSSNEAGGDGAGVNFLQQVLSSGQSLREFKAQVERECIESALRETGGNITRAAKLLGVKRPRLSQIIKENGLSLA